MIKLKPRPEDVDENGMAVEPDEASAPSSQSAATRSACRRSFAASCPCTCRIHMLRASAPWPIVLHPLLRTLLDLHAIRHIEKLKLRCLHRKANCQATSFIRTRKRRRQVSRRTSTLTPRNRTPKGRARVRMQRSRKTLRSYRTTRRMMMRRRTSRCGKKRKSPQTQRQRRRRRRRRSGVSSIQFRQRAPRPPSSRTNTKKDTQHNHTTHNTQRQASAVASYQLLLSIVCKEFVRSRVLPASCCRCHRSPAAACGCRPCRRRRVAVGR